jgi:hypothetical protein
MNFSSLSSLLHDLTSNHINRVTPAPKAQSAESARDPSAFGKKYLEGLGNAKLAKHVGKTPAGANKAPETVPAQLSFAPLPLRSELFQEARFFIRLDEHDPENQSTDAQNSEIFIYVETEHMGPIWVSLHWIHNNLSVKYYTENEGTSKILREGFSTIRGDLLETGFHEVALASQSRANLGGITNELLPKFDAYLLNQKV